MTTNPYFSNFSFTTEQDLHEDLIIESIQIHGIDMGYLPRVLGSYDDLLNEDDTPIFEDVYQVEMYVKDVDGFGGEGDFLSKFGLQIRDSMTFTVASKRFTEEVADNEDDITRPREGDLLYFPLNRKVFEVMHVEHEEIFYQLGKLPVYSLRCELFEYSNQRFTTGNTTIDTLFAEYESTSNSAVANVETVDEWSDNFTIEQEADDLIDFSINNPFGEEQY